MRLVLAGSLALGIFVGALLGANTPILVAIACGAILVFEHPKLRELVHWTQGAKGERQVGAVLESLSDRGFRCLHDLDIGRGYVDHVAVGPTGVFAIETKAWTRRVWLAPGPRLMSGRRDETSSVKQAI
jgi:hypothetical protein